MSLLKSTKSKVMKSLAFIFLVSLQPLSLSADSAAFTCAQIFESNAPKQVEVRDLKTFGQAMTEGMLLLPEQADLFEVYRQVFFGDPNTSLNDKTLKDVLDILARHPKLKKPHFTEYEISQIKKVYETPESLEKYLNSQHATAGQIRNNLFQIDENLAYWKKVLDYVDPQIPPELQPIQFGKNATEAERQKARENANLRAKFIEKEKKRFLKYLNRIISKANRDLLATLKNDKIDYQDKIKALFKTLKYLSEWMEKNQRNTQAIRQAMVDLVHTTGFNNQATQELLKSKNALDKIEGLRKVLDERDSMAMDLEYTGHFQELMQKLNIDFPTGSSKNENPSQVLSKLEQDVLQSPFTTKPTSTIRVRSLSIQEAPFRSCLGGSDCSSRTYFDKALDPNYNYFTLTNSDHQSSGHVTLVLGTAKDEHNQDHKVAFIDKLQNVPTQMIPQFLESVRRSLQEKGYLLGLPDNVGDHNGLSNMDTIRNFVQTQMNPQFATKLRGFAPHGHQYQFKNTFSRAYTSPTVRVLSEVQFKEVEIQKGQSYESTFLPAGIKKEQFIQDFLNLKDSTNEEDQIKFIKSGGFVAGLEKIGLYRQSQFINDIRSMLENPRISSKLKKQALYELILNNVDEYETNINKFTSEEQVQINAELKQWKNSTDKRKLAVVKRFTAQLVDEMKRTSLNTDRIRVLIRLSDVNVKDNDGRTPLRLAAEMGHKEVVEMLIKAGADMNVKDTYGRTPLLLATYNGRKEVAEMLIKAGADVNLKDYDDQTPLLLAASIGYTEMAEMLIKAGADVNLKDNNGNTPLLLATDNGRKEVVETLIKLGADVNVKGYNGETPLRLAAYSGHKEVVEVLIKAGADVNVKGYNGTTPLWRAAEMGHKEIAEMLIKAGADVNLKDKDSTTPLWHAAYKGHKEVVETLIKLGADVNVKDNYGQTLIWWAAEGGHKEVVEMLIKAGADVNVKDKYVQTLLVFAAGSGRKEMVETLIKLGADVNVKDKYGKTPLWSAADTGHKEVVEVLIKARADVNVKDKYGLTPLALAAYNGHKKIVAMLIKAGADVNVKDNNGTTPLWLAVNYGHKEVVAILKAAGARE